MTEEDSGWAGLSARFMRRPLPRKPGKCGPLIPEPPPLSAPPPPRPTPPESTPVEVPPVDAPRPRPARTRPYKARDPSKLKGRTYRQKNPHPCETVLCCLACRAPARRAGLDVIGRQQFKCTACRKIIRQGSAIRAFEAAVCLRCRERTAYIVAPKKSGKHKIKCARCGAEYGQPAAANIPKIERARHLFASEHMSIREVADALGWDSNTAALYRKLLFPEGLDCPCGQKASHRGLCSFRVVKWRARLEKERAAPEEAALESL